MYNRSDLWCQPRPGKFAVIAVGTKGQTAGIQDSIIIIIEKSYSRSDLRCRPIPKTLTLP
jgi:hypothetical protein